MVKCFKGHYCQACLDKAEDVFDELETSNSMYRFLAQPCGSAHVRRLSEWSWKG